MTLNLKPTPVEPHCDCERHLDGPCAGPLYLMLPDRHGQYRCARHIRLTDAWLQIRFERVADARRYTAYRRDCDRGQTFGQWYQSLSETDRQKAEMVGEIAPSEWELVPIMWVIETDHGAEH